MSKDKISDYSATANSNTDIAGINIDEGCAPSGINNAIRTLMKQIKDLYAGTSGDKWPVASGGTGGTTASEARTNLGLVIGTDVQAYDADLAAIASSGKGDQIASYGTYGVGFKNRIINGAMMIDQRNAGATVTATGAFPVDRFVQEFTGGGVLTSQQSTDAPQGFTNSLKVTVTTIDASIASGDYYQVTHNIEGYNVADFNLGTANASGFTISFWVKASQTGTYSAQLANSDGSRCYPSTITVNSANTWEYKTIVVPATTAGTWLTTNGKGLSLRIGFVYGSSLNGATVNTWGTFSAFANSFATATNTMMGTNGATFYITGVQLEKGSTATSFDYRPYGTELALCQRYFFKTFAQGTAPAQNVSANNQLLVSISPASTFINGSMFPVAMRTYPTVITYNPYAANSSFRIPSSSTDVPITGYTASDWGVSVFNTSLAAPFSCHAHYTATAEL